MSEREPIQEREHLMNRPLDWEAATDAQWLDALCTAPRPVCPRFLNFAEHHRPHVLRQYLVLHEAMGGYVGPPARRFLRGRRR